MGEYAGVAGSSGRTAPELDADLAGCCASGSSSKMAFLIRSMKGMGHVLTSSVLLARPRSTRLHHSEAQPTGLTVPNRSTIRPHLYPISKRTLGFLRGIRGHRRLCQPVFSIRKL